MNPIRASIRVRPSSSTTLIKEITEEFNITTIVTTHDMNSVLEIGGQDPVLAQGAKVVGGTVEDILRTDNPELNDFIFASSWPKESRKFEGFQFRVSSFLLRSSFGRQTRFRFRFLFD